MIKLQLLLRHPGAQPEVDPALRSLLETHGVTVTGEGRASLSATISEDGFRRLFGPPSRIALSTAKGPYQSPDLAVPAGLLDAISLITIAPHHIATNHTSR